MYLSACIEWLFAEQTENFAERVRLAKAAGLPAVEFWRWSNKDLDAISTALDETGLKLAAMVAEPMIALTDPGNRVAFLEGLATSRNTAQRLGAPVLIAQAGNLLANFGESAQRAALVMTLSEAADVLADSGVRLALEPLNTLVDHPGYFLSSTTEALKIVEAVGRPEIGLTYDIYHSAVMGERTEIVIGDDVGRIFHVHVADHPGRNEPGSGGIDIAARLRWLRQAGYDGAVGLEYRPLKLTRETLMDVEHILHV